MYINCFILVLSSFLNIFSNEGAKDQRGKRLEGQKTRGAKDLGAKDQGAKDRGGKRPTPDRTTSLYYLPHYNSAITQIYSFILF